MNQSKRLRELLTSGETLVMPDAYDPISARTIERAGFRAVQCSGYSFSLAACRRAEADVTFEENLDLTRKIVDAVTVPVMADGEDGFGDANTVRKTIREFIRIGAAGINIEDQVLGQAKGRQIVEAETLVDKIRAARETAEAEGNPDFIVNGRTDALGTVEDRSEGLRRAIDRANRYLDAGADLAFVVGVATLDEVKALVREVDGPISIAAGLAYNIEAFSVDDLRECGVARVSLPTLAIFSSIRAVGETMRRLRESGGFTEILENGLQCSAEELGKLLGG